MSLTPYRSFIQSGRYALVKLFEPFGKITLMDFLFHFSGPKRGQPRGYCFIEYSTKQVKQQPDP